MERSILDTDIYSEILRAKNLQLVTTAQRYRDQFGVYTLSAATVMELVKGLQQSQRASRIHSLLAVLAKEEVLPIDIEVAVLAGRIYGELQHTGQTIGRIDPFVAATAIEHKLVLVSGNTEHYERVINLGFDLRLQNWR
jgi:tRNA(fMet)-specific endonuclease VapC